MSLRMQCATSTALMLVGLGLMIYTVDALDGMPYVTACVLLWLTLVEYAVGRAWWVDIRELWQQRAT